jgi:hypothetical protein
LRELRDRLNEMVGDEDWQGKRMCYWSKLLQTGKSS